MFARSARAIGMLRLKLRQSARAFPLTWTVSFEAMSGTRNTVNSVRNRGSKDR
jgi:hypothetical protein